MMQERWTAEEYREYLRTGREPVRAMGAQNQRSAARTKYEETRLKFEKAVSDGRVNAGPDSGEEKAQGDPLLQELGQNGRTAETQLQSADGACSAGKLIRRERRQNSWTAEAKAWMAGEQPEKPKRRKYGNEPVTVDGIRFDSKHEARVYAELMERVKTGEIRTVCRQVKFDLIPGELEYRADFVTIMPDMTVRVIDAKSEATKKDKVYIIKKKLMRERWGIEIEEV